MSANEEPPSPTRDEIERLCMLHALVEGSCSPHELAVRLGLSADHEHAMRMAVVRLAAFGHVEIGEDLLRVTELGRRWFLMRLDDFGVR